jgi:hypothetical protein
MNGRLWVLKASQNGYTSRLTPRKWGVRTGDRAAEGTGLLNRRRAYALPRVRIPPCPLVARPRRPANLSPPRRTFYCSIASSYCSTLRTCKGQLVYCSTSAPKCPPAPRILTTRAAPHPPPNHLPRYCRHGLHAVGHWPGALRVWAITAGNVACQVDGPAFSRLYRRGQFRCESADGIVVRTIGSTVDCRPCGAMGTATGRDFIGR